MIDRAEIERLAREQICGGNDPQTPYERGAVQQLVAFGIRVKLQGHPNVEEFYQAKGCTCGPSIGGGWHFEDCPLYQEAQE